MWFCAPPALLPVGYSAPISEQWRDTHCPVVDYFPRSSQSALPLGSEPLAAKESVDRLAGNSNYLSSRFLGSRILCNIAVQILKSLDQQWTGADTLIEVGSNHVELRITTIVDKHRLR